MTSLHSRPPAPERGSTQAPGDRGCSASTGRSGLDRRPEAGATTCGWCQPLQNTTHPRSGERLDKSIALIQRGITRCICASRVTACHSTLFTLRSGHSGLGIYTTQRDAARPIAWANLCPCSLGSCFFINKAMAGSLEHLCWCHPVLGKSMDSWRAIDYEIRTLRLKSSLPQTLIFETSRPTMPPIRGTG